MTNEGYLPVEENRTIAELRGERNALKNALKGVFHWIDLYFEYGDRRTKQDLIDECNDARKLLKKLEEEND